MAARQNIIVVVPRSWARVRTTLVLLHALIERWMGPLHTISIQNYTTGTANNHRIGEVINESDLPEVAEDEIASLYTADPKRGAVLALHEGSYDVIILAMGEHGSALDRLNEVWRLVGNEAHAVLVGEELEIEEDQIATLLRCSQKVPAELDLCDAAIVTSQSGAASPEYQGYPWGGRLLLR